MHFATLTDMTEVKSKPRRRKQWKFEQFADATNCFEIDQLKPAQLASFYGNSEAFIELGAGTAEYSLQMARKYPEKRFLAVDIKADRLFSGARSALEEKLENIWFLRAPIDRLAECISESSIDTIWITFPDPFPRMRSAKHRLTHPRFLSICGKILKPKGTLQFKTDNHDLFCWSIEQFVATDWRLLHISFDLHDSMLPDETKLLTVYERHFLELEQKIHYLSALYPRLTL